METRHKVGCAVILLVVLGGFATVLYQFNKAFGVQDQRVIQILDSRDGRTRVELVRRYALFDLNYLIFINGQRIYASPDLRNSYQVPYREVLSWDQNGANLVLEIAGRRMYGYNLASKRGLPARELVALKVPRVTPEDLGLQADWPSRDTWGTS